MDSAARTNRIRTKLAQLEELDTGREIFGAESHRYILAPVLSAAEIEEFESRYSLRLPAEYRHYLMEIGDGGAGPY